MKDKEFLEDIAVLHQFIRQFFKTCGQLSSESELNSTQTKVLVAIAKNKENTMKMISEGVGLEKGSFTTVVDSLIERGYLERVRSEADRRKISLSLTEEGIKMAGILEQHMRSHVGELFHDANEETLQEVKNAVHILAQFARNTTKQED